MWDRHLFDKLVSCHLVDREGGEEGEAVEAGHTLLNLTFGARDGQGSQSCARGKDDVQEGYFRMPMKTRVGTSTHMDDKKTFAQVLAKDNIPVHLGSK